MSLRRAEIEAALAQLLATVPEETELRVVGTAAAVLHGVDLPTGDVDVLFRDRADVDRAASALRGAVRRGPELVPGASQYFCELALAGVAVELSTVELETTAPAQECAGVGPWSHWTTVDVGDRDVPVVAFELRLATEVARDRPDRLEPLLAHARRCACDRELLRRALASHGVDAARAQAALSSVAGRGEP